MRLGLIDLGSNTVKLALYQVQGNRFEQLDFQARFVKILNYISHGELSEEGIQRLIAVLLEYRTICQTRQVEQLECFSTASLRQITNQAQVIVRVSRETGITIHPISGEQEAYYNLLGMRLTAKEDSFLGQDLGGGSTQLFTWLDGKPGPSESFFLGALKMKQQFVAEDLPTRQEAHAIAQNAGEVLARAEAFAGLSFSTLYLMGGSARLLKRLLGADHGTVAASALDALKERYLDHPEQARAEILAADPGRLVTCVPGMLVILAVIRQFQVDAVRISSSSVREGWLLDWMNRQEKMQNNKVDNKPIIADEIG